MRTSSGGRERAGDTEVRASEAEWDADDDDGGGGGGSATTCMAQVFPVVTATISHCSVVVGGLHILTIKRV